MAKKPLLIVFRVIAIAIAAAFVLTLAVVVLRAFLAAFDVASPQ